MYTNLNYLCYYEYIKLILLMVCSILIKIFSNVSNINVYTSCFFIINTVYLCFKNDLVYRNSFILLTVSSIMYHQTHNRIIKEIDRLFVYNIVFQGGIRYLQFYDRSILHSSFVLINFLMTIFLYKQSKFCFDKDKTTAHNYHAMLHACSSLGHLSIIYLLD